MATSERSPQARRAESVSKTKDVRNLRRRGRRRGGSLPDWKPPPWNDAAGSRTDGWRGQRQENGWIQRVADPDARVSPLPVSRSRPNPATDAPADSDSDEASQLATTPSFYKRARRPSPPTPPARDSKPWRVSPLGNFRKLPDCCFYNILDFIPRNELLTKTCLVSHTIKKAIFNHPALWRSIIIGRKRGRCTHNRWRWLAGTELRRHVWRLVIEKDVQTEMDGDDNMFKKITLPNLQVVKVGAQVRQDILNDFVQAHPSLRGFIARKLDENTWLPTFMAKLEFCFMPGRVYQQIWKPSCIIEQFLDDRLPVFSKMTVLGWARVKTHDDFHSLRMLFPNLKALLIRMPRKYEHQHMVLLKDYCDHAQIRTLLLDVPCDNIAKMDWETLATAKSMQKLHIGRKRGTFERSFRDKLRQTFDNLQSENIVFHEGKFAILGELFEDFMGLKILKKVA